MKRGVIFGAGGTGRYVYELNKDTTDIIFFVDNDEAKWGTYFDGKEICKPEILKEIDFDVVFVGTFMGLDEIKDELDSYGVPPGKVNSNYVTTSVESRIYFLKRFAEIAYKKGIEGSVGEAGVYRGEFAKHINRYFYDRKCFLFDTFEGFTEYDISQEPDESLTDAEYLKNVNIEEVLAKMPNRENIVVKVGRFPETTEGITDKFAFVNLDMDLYEPTLEGLRFFYPRMEDGGVILIHDYFSRAYPNVEKAVIDFETETNIKLHRMPIGDDISMAIIK